MMIQIKAVHALKQYLVDGWRFLHPPNEEARPETISKQMALGMLLGAPDLIAFNPEGQGALYGIQDVHGRFNQGRTRFQAVGDQSKLAAQRRKIGRRGTEGFRVLELLRSSGMAGGMIRSQSAA